MNPPEKTPSRAALVAGFAAIYLIWGSTYLGIRVAVATIPPFLMAGSRFLLAGSLLAGYVAVTRGFQATARQWFDNAIVGALLMLGGNGLVSWAEQKVPSGIATLVVSLGPLFIVLLDWLVYTMSPDKSRGTRPTPAIFVGVALGIAGLAVLVGPRLGEGSGQLDPGSIGGLVLACFSWSAGSLYTRYARQPAETFTASAMQMLTGSGWLFLVSLLTREPAHFSFAAVSAHSFYAWCYLVVAGSLIGFTTFVWLMKHALPARVSTYAYVNPVVAVFLGWMWLQEPVSPQIFLGAAIIIAGVALITVARSRKSSKPAAPAPAAVVPAPAGSNSR